MPSILRFLIYSALLMTLISGSPLKALIGPSGSGKSYLVAHLAGCGVMSGMSDRSVTRDVTRCGDYIDTLGFSDSEGGEVKLGTTTFTLKGTHYSLFKFLEYLERDAVTEIEFWVVMKPTDRKFDDEYQKFTDILSGSGLKINYLRNNMHNGSLCDVDYCVYHDQTDIRLPQGRVSKIMYPKDWRNTLIRSDISGLSQIMRMNDCQELFDALSKSRDSLSSLLKSPPKPPVLENCLRSSKSCDSFSIGIAKFSFNCDPIYWTDSNCEQRNRASEHNYNVNHLEPHDRLVSVAREVVGKHEGKYKMCEQYYW
jgi:energy-coupling factor transporter ATP-binding protein EcfA2